MSTKFTAVMLAAVLTAAGVLALSSRHSASDRNPLTTSALASSTASQPATGEVASDAYLGDYKPGYAGGFNAGVPALAYPGGAQMESNAGGYLVGFQQGYADEQNQQASLRSQLGDRNTVVRSGR